MIYYRLSQRTICFIKCRLHLFGHFRILILIQVHLLLIWGFSWPPSLPISFLICLLLFYLPLIISLCFYWNPVLSILSERLYICRPFSWRTPWFVVAAAFSFLLTSLSVCRRGRFLLASCSLGSAVNYLSPCFRTRFRWGIHLSLFLPLPLAFCLFVSEKKGVTFLLEHL